MSQARKPRHNTGFPADAGSPGVTLPGALPQKDIPERETTWEGSHQETGFLRASGLAGYRAVGNPCRGQQFTCLCCLC